MLETLKLLGELAAVMLFIFLAFVSVMKMAGITLFRECRHCESRNTRTERGWILTSAPGNDGWQFVEDTDCYSCSKRERKDLPREEWPSIPFNMEA
jgi:hypothetical protein